MAGQAGLTRLRRTAGDGGQVLKHNIIDTCLQMALESHKGEIHNNVGQFQRNIRPERDSRVQGL